ncbi:DNA repair exonuclease [Halobacillus locisalis]|uniref:DNA repair exonuclease n=1 Tax=Halobacillus locisalis TaxID=220753 RepID=A0A838CSI8_9BACI|nr:DNA repair exonuclease [Halobacillus locisalis]MBA2174576.1 DNA repair exonuclease [Halobacillus locisalis]
MQESIRFIHSADLHLDSLFKTKKNLPSELLDQLRSSTFEAFDRLIEEAINWSVDFVLIVGDLYDEELRSLQAQVHLRHGFAKLEEEGIDVFLSYGNHDYINGAKYPIEFPPNVHIFKSGDIESFVFYKNGEAAARIYGFSYEDKRVTERKVEQYEKMSGAPLHIAMLHGSLESNTDHDVYAPFLVEEMYKKQMDYWALGHIHKKQTLSQDPPVIYPGNIQGRSRKESGAKGCYVVDLNQSHSKQTFLPLHAFVYERTTVDCTHLESPDELEGKFEEAKQSLKTDCPVMLDLELHSTSGLLNRWRMSGVLEEWIGVVNESESFSDHWVWIDTVHISDRPSWDEDELKQGQHFTGALLHEAEQITDDQLQEWLSPLMENRKVTRYVEELSEDEKRDILKQAKTIAIEKLIAKEESST